MDKKTAAFAEQRYCHSCSKHKSKAVMSQISKRTRHGLKKYWRCDACNEKAAAARGQGNLSDDTGNH